MATSGGRVGKSRLASSSIREELESSFLNKESLRKIPFVDEAEDVEASDGSVDADEVEAAEVDGLEDLKAPVKEVRLLAAGVLLLLLSLLLLNTVLKSAMLSSPSEKRLVSVISYHVFDTLDMLVFLMGVEVGTEEAEAAMEGKSEVAEAADGSATKLDLNQ